MRVRLALAAGLALLALALGLMLSGSPMVIASANSTLANGKLAETASAATACQSKETLPARISAIRLTLASDAGPHIGVKVLSGARTLTEGSTPSGWGGGSVTVPVRPLPHGVPGVRICFSLGATREKVALIGSPTTPDSAATGGEGHLPGRIKIEYLRPGHSSWWSLGQAIARRMGLGRTPSGSSDALLALLLMGGLTLAVCWLALREVR